MTTSTPSRRTIPLHRAYAAITDDQVAIRPSRRDLVGPIVQAALAALAVWVLVAFMNALPLWVLMLLLLFAIVAGPTAMLGFVYQVAGSSFLMERPKGTCRWQQGFLGLGLGTQELVPFARIKRIEVAGDFEDELPGGDLQDVVRWDVRVVKDNDRVLDVAATMAARSLAADALARANDLASSLAEMAGAPFTPATLPAWALDTGDPEDGAEDEA